MKDIWCGVVKIMMNSHNTWTWDDVIQVRHKQKQQKQKKGNFTCHLIFIFTDSTKELKSKILVIRVNEKKLSCSWLLFDVLDTAYIVKTREILHEWKV